jgi:hypothetical protein
MRRPGAAVWLIVTLAMTGCGGSSGYSGSSATSRRVATDVARPGVGTTAPVAVRKPPAEFASQATRVCGSVVPQLNRTVQQVNAVNAEGRNPLARLPKLAVLLRRISTEFGALHAGLARLRPPPGRAAAYATFLRDLASLRALSATMAADLRSGTIAGLNRYRPLAARFSARGAVLEAHRKRVLPRSACRNIGA